MHHVTNTFNTCTHTPFRDGKLGHGLLINGSTKLGTFREVGFITRSENITNQRGFVVKFTYRLPIGVILSLSMNTVLVDVEEKQICGPFVKNQVDKFREVVYDADGVLDYVAFKAMQCKMDYGSHLTIP